MTGVQTCDRKSTRLNSSHTIISYAVFCLKKKKINQLNPQNQALYLTTQRWVDHPLSPGSAARIMLPRFLPCMFWFLLVNILLFFKVSATTELNPFSPPASFRF